jgi:hypothetical protein
MIEEAAPIQPAYPVRFEMDYQEQLSKLSTFFRLILMIPLAIFVSIIAGTTDINSYSRGDGSDFVFVSIGALGSFILAHWIVVFLRLRPATWIFDTIVHIQRFAIRAACYFFLMVDKYPPFEGDWPVRYEVDRPETLSRWKLVFWKFITAIPHLLILIALWFVVVVVVMLAWFAILFTGRFPRGMHNLVEGVFRWAARVYAYVISLTDEYPPFSMR